MKICPDCGFTAAPQRFPRDGRTADGRSTRCAPCRTKRRRDLQTIRDDKRRRLRSSGAGLPGKVCLDCRQRRPFVDFPRNRSRDDGTGDYCHECNAQRTRDYRARLASGEPGPGN